MIAVVAWIAVCTAAIAVCALPSLLTKFEYRLDKTTRTLVILMVWCGVVPIRKELALETIRAVRRLRSVWELVPLASGTMPSLWGKFRPRAMVLVERSGWGAVLPFVVTPDHPDEFIEQVQSLSRSLPSR